MPGETKNQFSLARATLSTGGRTKSELLSVQLKPLAVRRPSWRLAAALWFELALPLSAGLVYDNSTNDLSVRFAPGTLEVGNEVLLTSSEVRLTQFAFEFWGTNSASPDNSSYAGPVQARVRFYLNDGPSQKICDRYDNCDGVIYFPSPSTLVFDSGWFLLPPPRPRLTLLLTAGINFPPEGLHLLLPAPCQNMTWTVQFQGMGATDSVGVDLFAPPVVGSTYADYWENQAPSASGWAGKVNTNGIPMSFAAQLDATPAQLALSSPHWSSGGQFSVCVSGTVPWGPWGAVIEASTNLVDWTGLATNYLSSGQFWYTNSAIPGSLGEFYRARLALFTSPNPFGPPFYPPLYTNPLTITPASESLDCAGGPREGKIEGK